VSNAALARHARVSVVACRKRKFVVARTRRAIGDEENSVLISAASAWETTTKYRLGKLPEAAAVALDFGGAIADQGFEELAISVDHASLSGSLPDPHRDPFDRMLIAQSLSENLVLVSKESVFDQYGVRRLW
jgi:PIN domain nuclease of toxin-antitoxin system